MGHTMTVEGHRSTRAAAGAFLLATVLVGAFAVGRASAPDAKIAKVVVRPLVDPGTTSTSGEAKAIERMQATNRILAGTPQR